MMMTAKHTHTLTQFEAAREWRAGNDVGRGFAPFGDAIIDVETAVKAYVIQGAEVLLERERGGHGVAVVRTLQGRTIAIADVHGAWAVEL